MVGGAAWPHWGVLGRAIFFFFFVLFFFFEGGRVGGERGSSIVNEAIRAIISLLFFL